MSGPTFLDMAQDLMHDSGARAAFDADPDAFLVGRGFDGLTAVDVADAVGYVADTLPADAAHRLTDPDGGGDGLARLAHLDPGDLEPLEVAADTPPAFVGHDPSGELDLVPDEPGDQEAAHDVGEPMGGHDDAPGADPLTAHRSADGAGGSNRVDEAEPEPGFGVGWAPGDADDVTAASPEFANVLDHPADLDLDVTHVPDLAFEATDPISEAIAWADHDEAGADAAPLGPGPDGPEHDHGADHDGHLEL